MDQSPSLLEMLQNKLLDPSTYRDNAASVVGALIGLFAAWMVAGWVSRLVYRSLKLAKVDETLARFRRARIGRPSRTNPATLD